MVLSAFSAVKYVSSTSLLQDAGTICNTNLLPRLCTSAWRGGLQHQRQKNRLPLIPRTSTATESIAYAVGVWKMEPHLRTPLFQGTCDQKEKLGSFLAVQTTSGAGVTLLPTLLLHNWIITILLPACLCYLPEFLLPRWSVASELCVNQQSSSVFLLRTAETVTGAVRWIPFWQKAPACHVQCRKLALLRENILPL